MPKCPSCNKEVYFGKRFNTKSFSFVIFVKRILCRLTIFCRISDALGVTVCSLDDLMINFVLLYLAEKVTSLGKDWHRPCLRCEKCKKTLTPGSHAEVSYKKVHRFWKLFFFLYKKRKQIELKIVRYFLLVHWWMWFYFILAWRKTILP